MAKIKIKVHAAILSSGVISGGLLAAIAFPFLEHKPAQAQVFLPPRFTPDQAMPSPVVLSSELTIIPTEGIDLQPSVADLHNSSETVDVQPSVLSHELVQPDPESSPTVENNQSTNLIGMEAENNQLDKIKVSSYDEPTGEESEEGNPIVERKYYWGFPGLEFPPDADPEIVESRLQVLNDLLTQLMEIRGKAAVSELEGQEPISPLDVLTEEDLGVLLDLRMIPLEDQERFLATYGAAVINLTAKGDDNTQ
jgi:hypothetical protein